MALPASPAPAPSLTGIAPNNLLHVEPHFSIFFLEDPV